MVKTTIFICDIDRAWCVNPFIGSLVLRPFIKKINVSPTNGLGMRLFHRYIAINIPMVLENGCYWKV